MSDFKTYWEDYKQTNPGYKLLDPQDLVLIGWIGRNAEIDEFAAQMHEMLASSRKIEKEVLQLRMEIARLRATDRSED